MGASFGLTSVFTLAHSSERRNEAFTTFVPPLLKAQMNLPGAVCFAEFRGSKPKIRRQNVRIDRIEEVLEE